MRAGAANPPFTGLTVLSRQDCALCEELLQELTQFGANFELPALRIVDVDSDPLLVTRHGLDVPVLLLDGVKVCQHHLDIAELRRLLRPR